jgi:hypothetical protein
MAGEVKLEGQEGGWKYRKSWRADELSMTV